jgi:hypothetical protein
MMSKIAIPIALLIAAGAFFFLTRDEEPRPAPVPVDSPSPDAEGPTELVYSIGTQLYVYDLETGESNEAASVPTEDLDVTLDGTRWVATDGKPDFRNPDPDVKPTNVVVGNVDDDDSKTLGIGYAPIWSPDDDQIAAVYPVDGYLLCGLDVDPEEAKDDPAKAGCREGERIVVYEPDGEEPVPAIGGGAWYILGWTGADRIAGAYVGSGQVKIGYAGAVDDQQYVVPVPDRDVLALSPTVTQLLVRNNEGASIIDDQANVLMNFPLEGGLLSAVWSPDGRTIAGISFGPLLMDAETGNVTPLGKATNTSHLVWSSDGKTLAYRQHLKAFVCDVAERSCESYRVKGDFKPLALR